MEIDLDPTAMVALEAVAEQTLLPVAVLASAFVACSLLGWSHPVVTAFWAPVIAAGRWPVKAGK